MSISKVFHSLNITATLCLLSACGGSESSQPLIAQVPTQPTITMLLAYENISCQPRRVTPALLTKELTDAGIEVRGTFCPNQPDLVETAQCSVAFTRYFMVDAPQDQEQRLSVLGYRKISSFPPPSVFPPLKASVCQ